MRFLANENFPLQSVRLLRQADIVYTLLPLAYSANNIEY
jgi:hypothetical protein